LFGDGVINNNLVVITDWAMKKLLGATAAILVFAFSANAQNVTPVKPRAVVELFTSQGCSSCPPADRLLGEMSKDPEIITVTLPVDYWDYLGWKDTLAQPAYSNRQKVYANMRSDRQVYTPQAVVNGSAHAIGSERQAIDKAILATRDHTATLSVNVTIKKTTAGYDVVLPAHSGAVKQGVIWAMPYANAREVKIGRGENSGRSVIYSNVALKVTPIGNWNGEAMSLSIPANSLPPDADGLIVLLQSGTDKKASQILGAAKLSKL
jgi:hypothetical protein